MKKGIDFSFAVTKYASCLKAEGYDFIGRYYNVKKHAKNLTLAEAQVLTAVGLSIIAVWEDGDPTKPEYFSYAKGVADGTAAYHYADSEIGQPQDTPIYFAVDFDAGPTAAKGAINDYFKGIQNAFNTISNNAPKYKVGVYGSGLVCSTIQKNNLAEYFWLAQSMGWAGSKTFKEYNMKQLMQITTCKGTHGGIDGDPDESPNDNEGSFTIAVASAPTISA